MEELDLSDNYIGHINCDLSNLTKLQVLRISHTLITSLSPNLASAFPHWTHLLELDLSHNKLVSLPDLTDLMSLGILDLSGNQLTSLPAGLRNLPDLHTFIIADNLLGSDSRKNSLSLSLAISLFLSQHFLSPHTPPPSPNKQMRWHYWGCKGCKR